MEISGRRKNLNAHAENSSQIYFPFDFSSLCKSLFSSLQDFLLCSHYHNTSLYLHNTSLYLKYPPRFPNSHWSSQEIQRSAGQKSSVRCKDSEEQIKLCNITSKAMFHIFSETFDVIWGQSISETLAVEAFNQKYRDIGPGQRSWMCW